MLLGGLAYGRPLAWGVLIFLNSAAMVAIVLAMIAHGGQIEVLNVAVALLTTFALIVTLLSAPMRRHVESRGLALRRPTAPTTSR